MTVVAPTTAACGLVRRATTTATRGRALHTNSTKPLRIRSRMISVFDGFLACLKGLVHGRCCMESPSKSISVYTPRSVNPQVIGSLDPESVVRDSLDTHELTTIPVVYGPWPPECKWPHPSETPEHLWEKGILWISILRLVMVHSTIAETAYEGARTTPCYFILSCSY